MIEKEFERYLLAVNVSRHARGNRKRGTKFLSRKIYLFSKAHNLTCRPEVFLGARRRTNNYRGYIDFVLYSTAQKYAIEIDSSNKKWSLEKLLHAAQKGYCPIWVRWYSRMRLEVPDDVYLIDLTKSNGRSNLATRRSRK